MTGTASWPTRRPRIEVDPDGDASGQSVFVSLNPIFDEDTGTLLGAQAVSIPHALFRALMTAADEKKSNWRLWMPTVASWPRA